MLLKYGKIGSILQYWWEYKMVVLSEKQKVSLSTFHATLIGSSTSHREGKSMLRQKLVCIYS